LETYIILICKVLESFLYRSD